MKVNGNEHYSRSATIINRTSKLGSRITFQVRELAELYTSSGRCQTERCCTIPITHLQNVPDSAHFSPCLLSLPKLNGRVKSSILFFLSCPLNDFVCIVKNRLSCFFLWLHYLATLLVKLDSFIIPRLLTCVFVTKNFH